MRKVIVRLIVLTTVVALHACSKDTPATSKPPVTTEISSVMIHDITTHGLTSYSFTVDSLNRLTKYIYSYHDSTVTPATTLTYQWVFSYRGADTLPKFYRRNSRAANILQYDAKGRVIKDSIVQDGTYSLTTINVFYQDDVMTIEKVIGPTIGHYIDTLNMSDGNVQRTSYWFTIPSLGAYHTSDTYTYTSYINPLAKFRTIGPSFFYENEPDRQFLSKNLLSKVTTDDGFRVINWVTDSYGRVVKGDETIIAGSTRFDRTIEFRYK